MEARIIPIEKRARLKGKRSERIDRDFLFCFLDPKCIKKHAKIYMSIINNISKSFQHKSAWGMYFCQLLVTLFNLQK